MSVEKCFAVYFPLKSKTVGTVKTAKWATGIVGVILAGYNSLFFFLITAGVIESSVYDTCVYIVDIRGTLDIVDSILYSFGPFFLMFLTNFAIIYKFTQNQQAKPLVNQPPGGQLWLSLFRLHFSFSQLQPE